ncbi:MAG: hypothetical protein GY913_12115 [Proteobacteria bacterium]|nr:hypothetical protein [Pseudomonadota bacterium]MCP4917661.1 hypothetical protein [Pseudomonadota bacterium]
MKSWIVVLSGAVLTASPVLASTDGAERLPGLVDESFEAALQDEEPSEEEAPAEAPAEEPAAPPPPVSEPLVSEAPVVQAPPPVGVAQPRDNGDAVTLAIVAAGGFAVGALAGAMGCCVLFFAFYY